ncbi:dihydrofolate reductase family protein [Sphingomonas sp. HITSZ_GF]|uniref:dihydrofolate reductase family protein n=1 Tax=Sphingomonas sp. HITSZ_GF TaxID=3037247 RepID=UPI00240D1D48|nr:dihydrofolate reductase family protein [Sphingomonas sp. HITSZ_GF]MDG2535542.1 dihydrofolate reductase family protein [Sphingomonas sp. HITSZ_GF]
MRKLTGAVFVSLDGIMQAPGGPTEDWTGGFKFGGWMAALADEAVGATIGPLFDGDFDLLLGRETYEIFAGYWPFADADHPIRIAFDKAAKHVVTHHDTGLDWVNSHRVASIEDVAELKRSAGPDLIIQGSSTLYPPLLAAGLIDRLVVMTFPVVLGGGKKLFGPGTPGFTLRMTDHLVSSGGTVIATYEPAGPVETGTFAGPEMSTREKARQERMKRG